jgi:hypothetical protein
MGAWRSSCSRVELLQERAVTTCTGGKINNLQEEGANLCRWRHCRPEDLMQERSVTTGGRINSLQEVGATACRKEEPLPHRGLLKEAGVNTGGRGRSYYIKEGVNTASGRSYYRREDQYPVR